MLDNSIQESVCLCLCVHAFLCKYLCVCVCVCVYVFVYVCVVLPVVDYSHRKIKVLLIDLCTLSVPSQVKRSDEKREARTREKREERR